MSPPSSAQIGKVLLVDDDPFVLALYEGKFKRVGLRVESAVDGAEALQKLESARPDVVILDLNLPRINGIEVLRFIRRHPDFADIPVVVLSNASTDEVIREAWAARPTRFLLKRENTPNQVVNEVVALLRGTGETPSSEPPLGPGGAPEPEAAEPEATFIADLVRKLITTDPHDLETFRDRLLDLYQSVRLILHRARHEAAGHFEGFLGQWLYELFEELYRNPSSITASSLRALSLAAERLVSIHASKPPPSARPGCAVVVVFSEDSAVREDVANILRCGPFHPIRIPESDWLWELLKENTFDAIVADVSSELFWTARVRKAVGEGGIALIYLTGPEEYRPTLQPGVERVARPIVPADLLLKLLRLVEQRLATGPAPDEASRSA